MNRNGLLLIVLVGLLTLLTVLSVLFVAMVRTDRFASFTQLDDVRARLLTRAGIEYAVARLRANPDPRQGLLDDPAEDWTYRETEDVPLHSAMNPSYHHGEPWTDLVPNGKYDDGIDVWTEDLNGNGVYDGWSGRLRGSYQSYGDTFKLRIEGQDGKIHLNGGFLDALDRDGDDVPDHRDVWVDRWTNGYHPEIGGIVGETAEGSAREFFNVGQGWNGQLVRLLDNLVEGLLPAVGLARDVATNPILDAKRKENDPFASPPRSAPSLGTILITLRPEGGYRSWAEVELAIEQGIGMLTEEEGVQVSSLLPPGGTWSELLKPHISLHAKGDRVIHPHNPFPFHSIHATYPAEGPAEARALKSFEAHLRPFPPSQIRKWLGGPPEIEERPSIRINLATRAVLIAAMTDLAEYGLAPVESRIPPSVAQKTADWIIAVRDGNEDRNRNGRLDQEEDKNGNGTWDPQWEDENGNGIWDTEDENRNGVLDAPFRSWAQWNEFCDDLVGNGTVSTEVLPLPLEWVSNPSGWSMNYEERWQQRRAEILKAHFNPNGGSGRWTADRSLYFNPSAEWLEGTGRRGYDSQRWSYISIFYGSAWKDNIFPYSTEWSFHPATGFSIGAFGRVGGSQGEVRSHRSAWTSLQLAGTVRVGSQADFVADRNVREYSSAPTGPLATDGTSVNRLGPETGAAVATYPEPMPLLSSDRAAEYDGYVMLATLEEQPDPSIRFLHHFSGGWDPEVARGEAEAQSGGADSLPAADTRFWGDPEPGLFGPDGVVVEADDGELWECDWDLDASAGSSANRMEPKGKPLQVGRWDRYPSYGVNGNLPEEGKRGLVGMWVKPLYTCPRVQPHRWGSNLAGEPILSHTASYFTSEFLLLKQAGGDTQVMGLGRMTAIDSAGDTVDGTGMVVENELEGRDGREHAPAPGTGGDGEALRSLWRWTAAWWNLSPDASGIEAAYWKNGKGPAAIEKSRTLSDGTYAPRYTEWEKEPFSGQEPGSWAGTRFFLGDVGGWGVDGYAYGTNEFLEPGPWEPFGHGSASVLDEVTIYDVQWGDAEGIAKRRWQDGRYYKEEDAVYYSPYFDLTGAEIRRVYWTQKLPVSPSRNFPVWNPDNAFISISLSGGVRTGELKNDAGEELELEARGPVRFEAHFHPTPEWDPDKRLETPLLQSPVLDDVTIYYELPGGAVSRLYEER